MRYCLMYGFAAAIGGRLKIANQPERFRAAEPRRGKTCSGALVERLERLLEQLVGLLDLRLAALVPRRVVARRARRHLRVAGGALAQRGEDRGVDRAHLR